MKRLNRSLVVGALSLSVFTTQVLAAFDMFVQVTGISGESTDDKHPNWIDGLSYSWRMIKATNATGGTTTNRVQMGEFVMTHPVDRASPNLFLACVQGTHIPVVKVELQNTTLDKNVFMQITMSNVVVTAVRPAGVKSGGDERPVEEVSFSYSKILWTYPLYDNRGTKVGDVTTFWDVANNAGQ